MTDQIEIGFAALNSDERAVWDVLKNHRGRAHAIRKADLACAVGLPERKMREAIKSLVEKHRFRIGSTPTHPPGYFIIISDGEAWECCRRYRGQALSILVREMWLRRITRRELLGQLELELIELECADG